jgi:hypothetical protein
MELFQPAVGSRGWGEGVNQNFQKLQEFANAVPQPQSPRPVVPVIVSPCNDVQAVVSHSSGILEGGRLGSGYFGSVFFGLVWYISPKSPSSSALTLICPVDEWVISNGDEDDDESTVGWVLFSMPT